MRLHCNLLSHLLSTGTVVSAIFSTFVLLSPVTSTHDIWTRYYWIPWLGVFSLTRLTHWSIRFINTADWTATLSTASLTSRCTCLHVHQSHPRGSACAQPPFCHLNPTQPQDLTKRRSKRQLQLLYGGLVSCFTSFLTSPPSFSHTLSTFSSSRRTYSSAAEPVGHRASDMLLFSSTKACYIPALERKQGADRQTSLLWQKRHSYAHGSPESSVSSVSDVATVLQPPNSGIFGADHTPGGPRSSHARGHSSTEPWRWWESLGGESAPLLEDQPICAALLPLHILERYL